MNYFPIGVRGWYRPVCNVTPSIRSPGVRDLARWSGDDRFSDFEEYFLAMWITISEVQQLESNREKLVSVHFLKHSKRWLRRS